MNDSIQQTAGRPKLQRRTSTQGSSGLDYSSALRIEEDISARVRSLLISRHRHHPPRTPSPSEEHMLPRSREASQTGTFDFGSARSVAKQARLERMQSGRLSLPVFATRKLIAESPSRQASEPITQSLKDTGVADVETEDESPKLPSAIGGARSTLSQPFLVDKPKSYETVVQSYLVPGPVINQVEEYVSPYDPEGGQGATKGFGFPPLILEDKVKPDVTPLRSPLLPEPNPEGGNPKLPQVKQESEAFDGNPVIGDSCLSESDEDHLFVSPVPDLIPRLNQHDRPQDEFKGFIDDVEKHGVAAMLPSHTDHNRSLAISLPVSGGSSSKLPHILARRASFQIPVPSQHISGEMTPIYEQTTFSAVTQGENEEQSLRIRQLSAKSQRMVDTPQIIETKQYNSSLLSAASRSSARHPLLKTSISSFQSIETELPVPPKLTTVAVVPQTPSSLGLAKDLNEPSSAFTAVEALRHPVSGPENVDPPSSHKSDEVYASEQNNQANLGNIAPTSGEVGVLSSLKKDMKDTRSQNPVLKHVTVPYVRESDSGTSLDVNALTEHDLEDCVPVTDVVVKPGDSGSTNEPDAFVQEQSKETIDDAIPPRKRRLLGAKKLDWFPDLLSTTELPIPYRTQLTAMPPKSRQSRSSFDSRRRTMSSVVNPNNEAGLENDTKPQTHVLRGSKENPVSSASEAFTKTISDLEHLLYEALFIARLAVNKEDAPSILETATELLKGRRKSDAGSVHESIRSMSSSHSNYSRDSDAILELPANEPAASSLVQNNAGDWSPLGQALNPDLPPSGHGYMYSSSTQKDTERPSTASNPLPRKSIPNAHVENSEKSASGLMKRPPSAENGRFRVEKAYGENEDTTSLLPMIPTPKPLSYHAGIYSEDDSQVIRDPHSRTVNNKREVHEYIRIMHEPPIQPRASSKGLKREMMSVQKVANPPLPIIDSAHGHSFMITPSSSFRSLDGQTEVDFNESPGRAGTMETSEMRDGIELQDLPRSNMPQRHISGKELQDYSQLFNLKNRAHVSLKEHKGFSLARAHRRQPIARDWSPFRKRFVASVACISTALIGVLVGIYAGEVPSMQYYIADMHHFVILGNVFFFVGLAIPTLYFWPLPLMHGRKPYTLAAMTVAMPLLFPQAIAVSAFRSPYVAYWRVCLLLPRALMGFALGFANMNFKYTLMDLFGASLQSGNPHQEFVDAYDVRRHGGGMGVWLGIWTWCSIGSIGVGFLIGATIINLLSPAWGFYISIILIVAVLLLNVVCPEVRRSAFRRSVVVVKNQEIVSRRLARGEIMMHRKQTGPTWWGQEVHHGMLLTQQMLRQPGFLIMALYVAWIYAQVVLIIVLLGSLMSRYYFFKSPQVGASVSAMPIGVLLSIPFQKASIFSRARHNSPKTNSMTVGERVHMSSHVIRRAIFTLVLPFAGMAYTVSSSGPPTPFMIPILFAGLIGFLSGLAIAECHGIIMETFDTSDLQPGMTGRPRGRSGERSIHKRTNYSSFPRVSSAFAITQSFGYLLAAGATGVGGVAQRHIGQQSATGVMAGILLLLTFLLLAVLIRFQEVQIIPDSRKQQMEEWKDARRASMARKASNGEAEEEHEPWHPIILGNPTGITRRMSVLELGGLSRWSEIRKKNRLIDEGSLEANHPNLATIGSVRDKMVEEKDEIAERISREMDRALEMVSISRSASRTGSRKSEDRYGVSDAGDLGGNVEVTTVERRVRTIRKPSTGIESSGSRRRVSEVREIVRQERSVG